jgi:branched-chain amino acid transport system substrate-binding protein
MRNAAAGLLAAALLFTGDTVASASSVPPTTEPSSPGAGDGVLTIGILLPQSRAGSWIGIPGINAADYARNRINEIGGVLGSDLVLVRADEGATADSALAAIEALLAAGVDAVVGPASSLIALQTLDQLMSAGVLTCSPTASSLLLDDYPNRNLFFRTIPSDSLQLAALAVRARNSGFRSTVMFYRDDLYGRELAEAALEQLERQGVELAASSAFDADDDLSAQIDLLIEHPDSTIIVLADEAQGMRMLGAIGNHVPELGTESLPEIYVNDAVRPATPADYLTLGREVLDALWRLGPVSGLSVRQLESQPPPDPAEGPGPLPPGPYALNTLDCINLIALAALETGTDDPEVLAAELPAVADGGAGCQTFAQCVAILDQDRDIDYQGPNTQNPLRGYLPERGDLARANVMSYQVNPESGVDAERQPINADLDED